MKVHVFCSPTFKEANYFNQSSCYISSNRQYKCHSKVSYVVIVIRFLPVKVGLKRKRKQINKQTASKKTNNEEGKRKKLIKLRASPAIRRIRIIRNENDRWDQEHLWC